MNKKINKNLVIDNFKSISETLKKIKLNGKGCVIVLKINYLALVQMEISEAHY